MAVPLVGVAVRAVGGGLGGGGGGRAAGGKIKIDATPFLNYLKKLQKKFNPPTTLGRVVEGEFLAVLKGSASKKRMRASTRQKAGGKYSPTSKFFKGWVKMNGKKYYVGPTRNGLKGFRYSDAMWAKLQARLKENKKRAEARVGLAKAVFYRVAADLKLKRYSIGWQEADIIKTSYLKSGGLGKSGKDGPVWGTRKVATSKKDLKKTKMTITFSITSTNTYNPFTGAKGNVQAAMRARQGAYGKAVTAGAFKDAKLLASFFPNIMVKK